jgi:hypothetical protein
LAHRLVEVVQRHDIDGLLALLDDTIELGPDQGMRKADLERELRRRTGAIYAMLFDTAQHRANVAADYARNFTPEHIKHLPSPDAMKSVRDYLLAAPRFDLRISFLTGDRAVPPNIAVVGIDWPGRPDVDELGNPAFTWSSRGWKVSHLFSVNGWSIAAPWHDPRYPGSLAVPPKLSGEQ